MKIGLTYTAMNSTVNAPRCHRQQQNPVTAVMGEMRSIFLHHRGDTAFPCRTPAVTNTVTISNFYFLHDAIHYLCANCDKFCKTFRLRRTFGTPIFQFRQFLASSDLFLPTPLLETVLYAYTNPSGDGGGRCQNVLTPP